MLVKNNGVFHYPNDKGEICQGWIRLPGVSLFSWNMY